MFLKIRVLKGLIQLSSRIFPSGTTPSLLDSFARQALWEGKNVTFKLFIFILL